DAMKVVYTLGLLAQTLLVAQNPATYVYSSYHPHATTIPDWYKDLFRNPFATAFEERDPFDFAKRAQLDWHCTPLGEQLQGTTARRDLAQHTTFSRREIDDLVKGTITLDDQQRNDLWSLARNRDAAYCTVPITTSDQAAALAAYFNGYTTKKLTLPW